MKGKKVYVLTWFRMYNYEPEIKVHVFDDLGDAILAKDELVAEFKGEVPEWKREDFISEEDVTGFECYKDGSYMEDSVCISIKEKEVE